MLESLQAYHLTTFQWTLAIFSATLVGIGKAGINSISIITVTTLAWVFGGKVSTGILLPLLISGDILAVLYYKREVNWVALIRLSPWIILGILLGVWIGKDLNEVVFKKMMGILVFIVVIGMFWFEKKPLSKVSNSIWFSGIMGIGTGFTSMVGNQAGGFANVYLLSMKMHKNYFIGTFAWLFLCVNCFKVPFHLFVWHTIDEKSVGVNLALLPFLVGGFCLGVYAVKQINDARYRKLILWLTAASAIGVLFL